MKRLVEVETAKALLTEAVDWSVWRWMTEKSKVRETADRGTAALDRLDEEVKTSWSRQLKKAYRELLAQAAFDSDPKKKRQYETAREAARTIDPKIKAAAKRVKQADDEAYVARMDAEQTFDEAERLLNAGMAREGSKKAILAYDLREKAIRKAELAGRPPTDAA